MEMITGALRQLSQVIDQERAIVDSPDSFFKMTSSQRAHTVKGLDRLGLDQVQLRELKEQYQQAFGDDWDALLAAFDNDKDLKRNRWGIPIGMVSNRVGVFTKREQAHSRHNTPVVLPSPPTPPPTTPFSSTTSTPHKDGSTTSTITSTPPPPTTTTTNHHIPHEARTPQEKAVESAIRKRVLVA